MTIIGKTVSVRPHIEATQVVGCCEWNAFPNNGCDLDAYEDNCRQHIALGDDVSFWTGSSMMCTKSPTTGHSVCAMQPADGSKWQRPTLGWSCSDLLQKNLADKRGQERKKRGQWSRMEKEEEALRKMSIYADHRCWGGIYNVLDDFNDLVDAKIPLTSLKSNNMMDLSALELAAAWGMTDVMAKLVQDYGASTEIDLTSQGTPVAVEFGKTRFYTGRSYDGVLQFLGLDSQEGIKAAFELQEAKREEKEAKQKEKDAAEARQQAEQKREALRRQAEEARRAKAAEEECAACCREPHDPYECEGVCGGQSSC